MPYSIIKGPMFTKFWNFYRGLQKLSSLMGFLLHNFSHFVHALRLFKALFFLTNFPGPTVIPCPTSIPDYRVDKKVNHKKRVENGLMEKHSHCDIAT